MHFHVKSIEIKKQYKSLFKLRVAQLIVAHLLITCHQICVTINYNAYLCCKIILLIIILELNFNLFLCNKMKFYILKQYKLWT